jgi:hypothetical protein
MLEDYNTAAPPSPLPPPGLWRWVREPPPATMPLWANRIVRLVLVVPLLWWLYVMVPLLVWFMDPANTPAWLRDLEALHQAEVLSLLVSVVAAALGVVALALWRRQARIARGLLLGFGVAVLLTLCSVYNVLAHSAI